MWCMTVLWKHLGFAYCPWTSEISWDVSRCVSPFHPVWHLVVFHCLSTTQGDFVLLFLPFHMAWFSSLLCLLSLSLSFKFTLTAVHSDFYGHDNLLNL